MIEDKWKHILQTEVKIAYRLEKHLWSLVPSVNQSPSNRTNLVCALADSSFRTFRSIRILSESLLSDQALALFRMLLESSTNCIFLAITERSEDIDDFMEFPAFDMGRQFEAHRNEKPRFLGEQRSAFAQNAMKQFNRLRSRYRPYKNQWCRLNLRERSELIAKYFSVEELSDFFHGHHGESSAFVHASPTSMLQTIHVSENGGVRIDGKRTPQQSLIVVSMTLNLMFSFAAQFQLLMTATPLKELSNIKSSWIPVNLITGEPEEDRK